MKIRMFVVHYKERYEGELGPNTMIVTDEFIDDSNAGWFEEEIDKLKEAEESQWQASTIIETEISTSEIMKRLYPETVPVKANLLGEND